MPDVRTLPDKVLQSLKKYRHDLKDKVIFLYQSLRLQYPNGVVAEVYLDDEIKTSEKLIKNLDRVISNAGGTDNDIEILQNQIRQSQGTLARIQTAAKKDHVLSGKLEGFFKQVNTNMETLIKDHSIILGRAAPGAAGDSKALEYSAGETLAMKASALLGLAPLTTAMKAAFDLKNHGKKALEEFKKTRIGKMANGGGKPTNSPSGSTTTAETPSVPMPSQTIEENVNKNDSSTEAFKRKGKWYEAQRNEKGQIKNMAEIEPLHAALIKFFSTSAFRTKWTKDLLEAVQGGGPQGDKKEDHKDGFGGLGSILSMARGILGTIGKVGGSILGNIAKVGGGLLSAAGRALMADAGSAAAGGVLGTVAAAGAAGVAGWEGGRLLGTHVKWGGESLDKHTQDFFSNNVFSGENKKAQEMDLNSNITDPKMRKKIELQRQGLSSQEAYRKVYGNTSATIHTEQPIGAQAVSSAHPISSQKDSMDKLKTLSSNDLHLSASANGAPTGAAVLSQNEIDKNASSGGSVPTTTPGRGIGSIEEPNKEDKTISEVPVDTAQVEANKATQESLNKLQTAVTDMHQTIKDGNKSTSKRAPSGYDANNTRNPVLSSLGAGNLDIA